MNKTLIFLFFVLSFSCSMKSNKIEFNNRYNRYINNSFMTYDASDNLNLFIEFADLQDKYQKNKNTLRLKCSIENNSDFSENVYLKDSYLSYPLSFYINLNDRYGNILAQEFTGYFYDSKIYYEFSEESDDRIILNPGEKITKIFYFKDIIGHYFINDVDNGKYYITIVFINHTKNFVETRKKYISNTLEIEIKN